MLVECIDFINGLLKFFVWVLVWGYLGVILWCVIFMCFMYFLNLKDWNGFLLFVLIKCGILYVLIILFNIGMIVLVVIDFIIFMIG